MKEPKNTENTETINRDSDTIIKKDESKQIVTGPVLIPDEPDRELDVISKDNIERVAYDFMESHQAVDEMHDRRARKEHSVVESYIAPSDMEINGEEIGEGTWMLSVRLGDEAWKKVENGDYKGFSIEGDGIRNV